MECHKCKSNAMIQVWERDGVHYEQTPCSKCELKESSLGTVNYHVDYLTDAVEDDDGREDLHELEMVGKRQAVIEPPDTGCDADGGSMLMPLSVLADTVRFLLSLPLDAIQVVWLRFRGLKYREIALAMGRSVDAVEKRHLRLLSSHPALGALFPGKVRKSRMRRRLRGGIINRRLAV